MDDMINSTKKTPAPTVLAQTLSEMDEFDVNKLNDTGRAAKKAQ